MKGICGFKSRTTLQRWLKNVACRGLRVLGQIADAQLRCGFCGQLKLSGLYDFLMSGSANLKLRQKSIARSPSLTRRCHFSF